MINSRIGNLIKKSPYKREYIQKYMGVSANTLSNWSTGKTRPTIEDAFKLSRLLEVTIEDLFDYVEGDKIE